MTKLERQIHDMLTMQELTGWQWKPFIDLLSPHYRFGNDSLKLFIINKIESMQIEPGVIFPTNYKQLLEGKV
ncbi:TPA: hypothetical protein ACGQSM_003721 [Serratia liquefaciens]